MKVHNNIDGVWKTADDNKENIDGKYENISTISLNINGVWKCSYPDCTVKIYDGTSLSYTYTVSKNDALTLPTIGYSLGYSTDSSATTATYSNGQSITITEDITLYMVIPCVTRIYDGTKLMFIYTKNKGQSLTLPTVNGSNGYARNRADTTASYTNGQSITVTNDLNLFIVIPCTIKIYNGNTLYTSYTKNKGDTLTLETISGSSGYSTSLSSATVSYTNGQSITVTADLTLYAINYVTVSIYYNGSLYNNYSHRKGALFTMPYIGGVTGFTITAMSVGKSLSSPTYLSGVSYLLSSNISLYGLVYSAVSATYSGGYNASYAYCTKTSQTITLNPSSTAVLNTNNIPPFIKIEYLNSNGDVTSTTFVSDAIYSGYTYRINPGSSGCARITICTTSTLSIGITLIGKWVYTS